MGVVDIEHATQSTLKTGARHSKNTHGKRSRGTGDNFAEDTDPPSLTVSCISSLSW